MARQSHPCAAPGCTTIEPTKRGFCEFHYRRFMAGRALDAAPKPAAGATERELDRALATSTDDCVEWSMALMGNGYPLARHSGVPGCREGHRIICILAHGEPPFADAQAAHRCGNRKCVNHRHLRWATAKENAEDRERHGTTARGERGRSVTSNETAHRIVALLRTKRTARQIAAETGASIRVVQKISAGESWNWIPRG